MMEPMAAVVPGAEPEMAPKNMQERVVIKPRLPVTQPTKDLAKSTSFWAVPPLTIRVPHSM